MKRTPLAFPVALVITLALAIVPARWQMGWTGELANIVRIPIKPFSDTGDQLGGWLKPPRSMAGGVPAEAVEELIEDRDLAQQLYQAEHLRVLELERQVRNLQSIDAKTRSFARSLVIAYVSRRTPGSPHGPVDLRLERGASGVVPAGTIAVHAGVHLLGRTVGESGRTGGTLLPLTSRGTGPLRARVYPRDEPNTKLEQTPILHLMPNGAGLLEGVVDREQRMQRGDLVRLIDPAWPKTAQGMLLGEIESVAVDDQEPLRNAITVKPLFEIRDVAEVTLVVEASREHDSGEGRSP